MWVPARRHDPEWMDRPDNSLEDMRDALRDIRLVNRHLGGSRVLLRALEPFLDGHPSGEPLEVLDVGTGGADLPVDLVLDGRRRARRVRVTAVDRDVSVAALAARAVADHPEIRVIRADARHLPFRSGSFDVVAASMFLHHFVHADVVRLLREFRRIARRAVVINDLRRHRFAWAFIGAATRVTRRCSMVIHDAPLSVLRGFTDDELTEAAREAGVEHPSVERQWPFRLALTIPGDIPLSRHSRDRDS